MFISDNCKTIHLIKQQLCFSLPMASIVRHRTRKSDKTVLVKALQ